MQISAKCKKNYLKINILDLFLPAKTGPDHKTLAYQSRCLCFLTEMCASWANSRTKWICERGKAHIEGKIIQKKAWIHRYAQDDVLMGVLGAAPLGVGVMEDLPSV